MIRAESGAARRGGTSKLALPARRATISGGMTNDPNLPQPSLDSEVDDMAHVTAGCITTHCLTRITGIHRTQSRLLETVTRPPGCTTQQPTTLHMHNRHDLLHNKCTIVTANSQQPRNQQHETPPHGHTTTCPTYDCTIW